MKNTNPNKFRLAVSSNAKNLSSIRNFIADIALKAGFDKDIASQIELAVDEASTNVIKHAHQFDSRKNVDLEVILDDEKMVICICDQGVGFDADKIATPDLEKYIREARKGGFGIYLMRNLMDEVKFEFNKSKGNCVRLTKYLKSKTSAS